METSSITRAFAARHRFLTTGFRARRDRTAGSGRGSLPRPDQEWMVTPEMLRAPIPVVAVT